MDRYPWQKQEVVCRINADEPDHSCKDFLLVDVTKAWENGQEGSSRFFPLDFALTRVACRSATVLALDRLMVDGPGAVRTVLGFVHGTESTMKKVR